MRVKIDPDICIGCGLCVAACPEVYEMKDDKAVVIIPIAPKELEDSAKKGADECPVTAIIVE